MTDPGARTPAGPRGGSGVTAAGNPAGLAAGDNVTASDDGRRLYAAVDGMLEITAGRVSVRPEYVIDGDVDLETGSLSFTGHIIVRGSARRGFRVIAGGQVVIMGDVEDEEVRGEILVWVNGAAVGNRSIILAGSNLVLEQLRNRISGGYTWAGQQVPAGEIGTVAGTATRIDVGVDPFAAELAETLTATQSEHRNNLDRIEVAVARFLEQPEQSPLSQRSDAAP